MPYRWPVCSNHRYQDCLSAFKLLWCQNTGPVGSLDRKNIGFVKSLLHAFVLGFALLFPMFSSFFELLQCHKSEPFVSISKSGKGFILNLLSSHYASTLSCARIHGILYTDEKLPHCPYFSSRASFHQTWAGSCAKGANLYDIKRSNDCWIETLPEGEEDQKTFQAWQNHWEETEGVQEIRGEQKRKRKKIMVLSLSLPLSPSLSLWRWVRLAMEPPSP